MSFAVISLLGTHLAWPFVGCFPHGSPSPRGVLPPQLARRERKPRPLSFSKTCLAVGANQRGKTLELGALSLGPATLGSVRSPLTPFPLTCPWFSCLDVQPGLPAWPHSPAQAHTVSSWSVLSLSPEGGRTLAASPATTPMPPLFLVYFILDIAS